MDKVGLVKWIVDKRNLLFLTMCISVHCFLLILFIFLHINGMILLNGVSLIFYTWIFLKNDFSSRIIVNAYFEIIIFSSIATIMIGRQGGFLLYIVGMI